ncbi:unnamed protein product, partial [Rotaria sordida]
GGNACSTCGKCRDWYYNGGIDRRHIYDIGYWYRRYDATCCIPLFLIMDDLVHNCRCEWCCIDSEHK